MVAIDGYTLDNPPSDYGLTISKSVQAVRIEQREQPDYFLPDNYTMELRLQGIHSLNRQSDLDELETLQTKAINGGSFTIDFDPFFSGSGTLTDSNFPQENQRGEYDFTFLIESESTDATAYPAHSTPSKTTTFTLGSFTFGFDPEEMREAYLRDVGTATTYAGQETGRDRGGLKTKVTLQGYIDGAGQQTLRSKAKSTTVEALDAEFQDGNAVIQSLEVSNNDDAPDYVTGLFDYDLSLLLTEDAESGTGQVTT